MKIVQILLSERVGGAESLVRYLAEEWTNSGIENGILYVDPPNTSRGPASRVGRLRKALAEAEADVILAHSAIPAVYARICAPSSALKYSVLHSAGDDFQDRKLDIAERMLRRRTNGVIAVSAAQAAVYQSRYGRSVPVHVIPNGIGRRFALAPISSESPAEPHLISAVARLVPQKKPELWLRAVSAIMREFPQMSAEWWGPPENDEFEREQRLLAIDLGLDGVLRGPTTDAAAVYARTDILLHTSAREAHSVGLLEAAAVGVPILCSDDVARTLPSGIDVTTFRTDDVDSLISRLRFLISEWARIRVRARGQASRVSENHGVRATAHQYLTLVYSDLGKLEKGR